MYTTLSFRYERTERGNLMTMKRITAFFITFFLFLPFGVSHAIPFEVGLQVRGDYRFRDKFDLGIENFRSSLTNSEPTILKSDGIKALGVMEAWIRFSGVIGDESHFGLAIGNYYIPSVVLDEYRNGPEVYHANWDFRATYLMFTYHYAFERGRRGFLWGWRPEIGGGFGYAPNASWKSYGYRIKDGNYTEQSAYQESNFGTLLRLEAGLSRMFNRHLFYRIGLSLDYLNISSMSGSVQGLNGGYYVMGNGGIVPITENITTLIAPESVTGSDYQSYIPPIQGRSSFTMGTMGIFFSAGARF